MENNNNWIEANQKYLVTAIQTVRAELELFRDKQVNGHATNEQAGQKMAEAQALLAKMEKELPSPPAIETLAKVFGLSAFERKIILMCAGIELDSDLAALIERLQETAGHDMPSFSLAMAAFSDSHWSALSPERPLTYWRMIELGRHKILTRGFLQIDEQLLYYLTGLNCLDERLSRVAEPVFPARFLAPSHQELSEKILQYFKEQLLNSEQFPAVRLDGNDGDTPGIAAAVAAGAGRKLFRMHAHAFPASNDEVNEFSLVWNRESILHGYALLIDCCEMDASDKLQVLIIQRLIEKIQSPLFICTGRWIPKISRPSATVEVHKPERTEQSLIWQESLGKMNIHPNGILDKLVSQFNLGTEIIRQISEEFNSTVLTNRRKVETESSIREELWKLCCKHSRPRIDELAQRIGPVATWKDIVLPEAQKEMLREIAIQVRQRKKVYDDWGFAASNSRGLGISALFTGESGTGKTMAAEVLANELSLDLYRIDLSQVVNKYIGETEKNLKKIFDAAEEGGAILLFDEADALFGKRSEVKDSHDRYSNIEVSYLLQRMEAYRGLAVLTTNMKSALDKAFLRRIRFIVHFPFPGATHRAEIWAKVFPANTPLSGLNLEKLARMDVPGGNIRNIALNAAFLAADENLPVGMKHVLKAARSEFNKLEKSMNIIEADPQ
jgi:ATP-dependent 26S proteasome regulatory subunit